MRELLTAWQVDHLVICGYASEFCVDTTVRSAAAQGYPVTLVSDAHTTHDKPHASGQQIRTHENATLPNVDSFGVKITAIVSVVSPPSGH
ncbi:isochorismatase family protein [Collimonas pratensis]|uniref:isochorismatase family protein n=1 Tax=Collimonas pratensis TaxID=279113 RepID=UPI000B2CB768